MKSTISNLVGDRLPLALFVVWSVLALISVPIGPVDAAVVQLRAGTSDVKGTTLSDGMDKLAELVKQKSNGTLVITNFYQALGVEQQLTQSVMSGSVDVGMCSNGNAGRFTDAFVPFDLPFLFKTHAAGLKAFDSSVGRTAVEKFEKDTGLKLLFVESQGAGRDIQTRAKALRVPADIKGLKIRVVSTPADLATFKAWGANPTPIDWGQTYTALQQGVVDGLQLVPDIIAPAKIHEVVKYNLRLNYQMVVQLIFINGKKFASLSPEHQKALMDAAEEAKVWQRNNGASRIAKVVEDLANVHGMKVYEPTPAEYAEWAAVREKVWEDVSAQMPGKVDLSLAKRLYESQ